MGGFCVLVVCFLLIVLSMAVSSSAFDDLLKDLSPICAEFDVKLCLLSDSITNVSSTS